MDVPVEMMSPLYASSVPWVVTLLLSPFAVYSNDRSVDIADRKDREWLHCSGAGLERFVGTWVVSVIYVQGQFSIYTDTFPGRGTRVSCYGGVGPMKRIQVFGTDKIVFCECH